MNRMGRPAMRIGATLALMICATAAFAQHMGPMHGMGPMRGPTAMLTRQDAGSAADMRIVHELLYGNAGIRRSVTNLPDGVTTLTESDDPRLAQALQAHVASMSQRLAEGREFNIFSDTLPVLFDNAHKISSKVEVTAKGVAVTRTSTDPKVAAALQGHAAEVTELVQEGMTAMHRGMMRRIAGARDRR